MDTINRLMCITDRNKPMKVSWQCTDGWTHGQVGGSMDDGRMDKQRDRQIILVQDHWIQDQIFKFDLGTFCLLALAGHETMRLLC